MLERRFTYYKGTHDKESVVQGMLKYVDQRQQIDLFLEGLIRPFIQNKSLRFVDVCCGVGHILHFLHEMSPDSEFVGIDQTPYLVEEARSLCKDQPNISFLHGDVYDILPSFKSAFDIAISWKTLSWIPYYDEMLRQIIGATKRHVFLSSLFYDGDIDFEIKVHEYGREAAREGFTDFYNVYSLPRFIDFAIRCGAKNVEAFDFDIRIDLPRGDPNRMGTYTTRLENGKRLQISGAVVMAWKILRIDL